MSLFNSFCVALCLVVALKGTLSTDKHHIGHDPSQSRPKVHPTHHVEKHVHTHTNYISGISKQSQIILTCAVLILLMINYLAFLVSINWDHIYPWIVRHGRDPVFAIISGVIAVVIVIVSIVIAYYNS